MAFVAPQLHFVACVNDVAQARAHLLRSPCFASPKPAPLLLVQGAHSAADGLSWALGRMGPQPNTWVVQLHQDVYLPAPDWPLRFAVALAEALQADPNLAVAGVYGVDARGQHQGHVYDRDRWLGQPFTHAPAVRSLDELLLAVRADCCTGPNPLALNPNLGWHLYGTDLALHAAARGLNTRVLHAPVEHHSTLARDAAVEPETLAAFEASARRLRQCWPQALPVVTPMGLIAADSPAAAPLTAQPHVQAAAPALATAPTTPTAAAPVAAPSPIPPWSQRLQGLDYRWLLPAIGALPPALRQRAMQARGAFNARHDRDWVSLALGHTHIAPQSAAGYGLFNPAEQVADLVRQRFETVAREEVECRLLARRGLSHFQVDAADALARLAQRPRDRGLVLVTAHLDTFVIAIAALAATGEVVHPVMSSISADPRLHPAVREHFAAKYEGLQRHLNGGQLADAETQMRHFYKALARKEIVVVIADAPAPATPGGATADGLWLPWLGAQRLFAQGALRLALRCGAALGAFVCDSTAPGKHRVHLSPLQIQDPNELLQKNEHSALTHWAQTPYFMLQQHILAQPGRWWAAHLLPFFASRPL